MNASTLGSDDFIARFAQPFQICLGPAAEPMVRKLLQEDLLPGARVLGFEGDRPPAILGPAILLLAPEDLVGRHRARLLELARTALPGRPVLYGSTKSREVLLDAINGWRVFRIVPETPRASVLLDAVRKAQEAVEIECGLEQTAADLRRENASLEEALHNLQEAQDRLRHAERLATLGRITTSLIPVIASHLDALQEFNALVADGHQRRDPRIEELLGYAFTGIRSLDAMLDEIRSYAESRPEVYNLNIEEADEVVKFAVSFSRYDPMAAQRRLMTDLAAGARIRVDAFRIYQVVINLLRNAFQATPKGGEIAVRTSVDGREVVIDVENAGEPIPAEVQEKLFQPFFSTKGEDGIGLGLSMCRATIERHGGSISCSSGPGMKTRFRIRLPRAE
jgi:signal transduction histidine kinase